MPFVAVSAPPLIVSLPPAATVTEFNVLGASIVNSEVTVILVDGVMFSEDIDVEELMLLFLSSGTRFTLRHEPPFGLVA